MWFWQGRSLAGLPKVRVVPFARNSLLNRYHPRLAPATDAILQLDDDGPFLPEQAAEIGFQLFRRSSSRQVGALGRHLIARSRTASALRRTESGFASVCAGDTLKYHFKTFPPFGAHMVSATTDEPDDVGLPALHPALHPSPVPRR